MAETTKEEGLLERARTGDLEALDELLRAVQPQLYRYSMKMCRHEQDAEDVLQDSLMTLARSFRDFRGASSLSTWLFSIARSFCIKKRRRSKFAPTHEESLDGLSPTDQQRITSQTPTPDAYLESAEIWRQVQWALHRIEPDYREVLVLRDIEGLSAKEVAEVVGLSVAAVKSRLHRSRLQLRDHLATSSFEPRAGCPDIRLVFSQHLEGDLSAEACSTMEAHVSQCPICAPECEGLKAALNACSNAPAAIPEDVRNRVQRALRAALKGGLSGGG